MEIKRITQEVFVGHGGEHFLSEEAARMSFLDALKKEKVDELAELLEDAGGVHYDFSVRYAAEWLLDNANQVLNLLRPFVIDKESDG